MGLIGLGTNGLGLIGFGLGLMGFFTPAVLQKL